MLFVMPCFEVDHIACCSTSCAFLATFTTKNSRSCQGSHGLAPGVREVRCVPVCFLAAQSRGNDQTGRWWPTLGVRRFGRAKSLLIHPHDADF